MKKRKGFTIIELIVVVSVSLMFFGISLARYNDNAGSLKLKNEAKKLVDVFELAKKKALSADLPITPGPIPTFCTDFTGYRINVQSGSYSLLFGCASVYTSIKNYNLTSNILIVSGTGDYNFPPLMNDPQFANISIVFYNSSIGKYVEVTISPIGIVTFVDTVLTSLPPPSSTPTATPSPIPPTATPTPTPTVTPIPCWATNNACDSACVYSGSYSSCGNNFPNGGACSSNGTGLCYKRDPYNSALVCYYDSLGNCNECSDLGYSSQFNNIAIQCTWKN